MSPKYCRDSFRYLTLGFTEAEWLVHYIFNYTNNNHCNDSLIWEFGLSKQLADRLINPQLHDPYDCYNDVTLHSHHSVYQGKLDWILVRHCQVVHKSIHNNNYTASDHKLLCMLCYLTHIDVYINSQSYLYL